MNGAILDFNLLLGKVAEMGFYSIFSHSKKVWVLLSSGCCNLAWIYPFFCGFLCGFLIGFVER